MSLLEVHFGAAVHVTAFFSAVVVLEGLAVTNSHHAAGGDALGAEVGLHAAGAALGQLGIVGIGTLGVGPAGEDDGLVGMLLDNFGSFVKNSLGLGIELGGVESEVDATEDENGFGLAAEDGEDKAFNSSVAGGQVFSIDDHGIGIQGSNGLNVGFALRGVGEGDNVDGQVALGSVDLADGLNEVNTAVVVTVGEQDEGSVTLHAAQEGLVGGKAVAHVGHTAEHIEAVLQLADGAGHGATIPGTLGKNGAVGGNGVQAAHEGLVGDGGVDALHHVLGNSDLGLFQLLVGHHHGAGIVHDKVEALDLLGALNRSGNGGNRVAQYQYGSQEQETQSFHFRKASKKNGNAREILPVITAHPCIFRMISNKFFADGGKESARDPLPARGFLKNIFFLEKSQAISHFRSVSKCCGRRDNISGLLI